MGLIALLFLGVRRGVIRKEKLLPAILCTTIFLVAVPAIMAAAYWLVSRIFARRMIVADSTANSLLLVGLVSLGACTGAWLFVSWRRRLAVYELSIAGLILVCILSWIMAFILPAGSYLLFWPLTITTAGLLVAILLKESYLLPRIVTGILGM